VDFPQHKTLPEAQQQANARLDKTYGINSYPTIILLNADGSWWHEWVMFLAGRRRSSRSWKGKVARTKAKTSVAETATAPSRGSAESL